MYLDLNTSYKYKMEFAKRVRWLEDTSMVEAFDHQDMPGMISFAAGIPSAETYPLDRIRESFDRVIIEHGKQALSYCSTLGYLGLREIMSERMKNKFGIEYGTDEIIMTSGSQQGLDMSGMAFIDPGDVVLFESPSYLGAVSALHSYQASLVGVPTDEEGLTIEGVREALEKYGDKVRLIYVNPDFQNPTGRSWSDNRRRDFMEFISEYDIPVLEDAAYGELAFNEVPQKPLAYYDKKGQVIYVGTFSKIFCPGMRVAWLCARNRIMEKYLVIKSAADLSSSTISQWEIADFLKHNDIEKHIEGITSLYSHRCDVMADGIKKYLPGEVTFRKPEGGIFIWLSLPEGKDARILYKKACDAGVAFIPGTSFYPNADVHNELRLNFSNTTDEESDRGLKILGRVTEEFLSE